MPLSITGTLSPRLSASTAGQSTFGAIAERRVLLAAGARTHGDADRSAAGIDRILDLLPGRLVSCEYLIPERRSGLRRDFLQRDTRTAADHHHRSGRRCASDRRQLAVGMKPSLVRDRSDYDRRKEPLPKQRDAEIQAEGVDQHPRPQRDPIEAPPVAASNERIYGRRQLQLRLLLVFQCVDELGARRHSRPFRGWLHARHRRRRARCDLRTGQHRPRSGKRPPSGEVMRGHARFSLRT
jgi:hypothetical protein